jgi:hypothetical protein
VADGFDPNNFGCASINARGDVAFRAGRLAEDGFNTVDGIYRVDAGNGRLTTIAENERRFTFIGVNPSMNDSGQVSFAASLERGGEAIFRGRGGGLTNIAATRNGPFIFFGFDTSINNALQGGAERGVRLRRGPVLRADPSRPTTWHRPASSPALIPGRRSTTSARSPSRRPSTPISRTASS